VPVTLSEEESASLRAWARHRKTSQSLATRSRTVLACAEGKSNTAVAEELGLSRPTVARWRNRSSPRAWRG